jgi:predicted membrane-bound mannosyltransferase/DNA-binding beta-propeller fold protein YncE
LTLGELPLKLARDLKKNKTQKNMATLENYPNQSPQAQAELTLPPSKADVNALNSLLARAYLINWESVFYIAMFLLAVVSRLMNLGDRVMSHDESLHTKYSHELYDRGIFQHTPLMHGPVLFHMTALSYFIFGDSDFSARLYPAILGIIMVLMPKLLFERWLGKAGAMVSSVLILISPMLLYHHRYIREDTPAIFFGILMVYAMFAYIDGPRKRQVWLLFLFAGATLLNLASKETAFMYILFFALFLILFLLFQMIQGWLKGYHSSIVGWASIGTAIVPVAGVIGTLVVVVTNALALVAPNTDAAGATPVNHFFPLALTLGIAVPIGGLVWFTSISIVRVVWQMFGQRSIRPALQGIGVRGQSSFVLIMGGVLLATTVALLMTNVLSVIIPPGALEQAEQAWAAYSPENPTSLAPTIYQPSVLISRLLLWLVGIAIVFSLITVAIAYLQFRKQGGGLPKLDLVLVGLVAVLFCFALIVVEERSRNVPNISSEVRKEYIVNDIWIYGSWVVGVLAVGGIAFLRLYTTFWQEMRRYPAFDVVIVLGSMILPWVAALPIFLAGHPLDESYNDATITASIIGLVPFVAVAVAAGLAWRPGLWVAIAATFYAIFVFFYTTIFTNPNGVATGVVGSLGYWLAQQGVRRGGQPQYYYMLIQLPIYEYLVVIGSACAGVVGLGGLWRFRAGRYAAKAAEESTSNYYSDQSQLAQAEAAMVVEETPAPANLDTAADSVEIAPPGSQPDSQPDARPAYSDAQWDAGVALKPAIAKIPQEEVVERPGFIAFVGLWALAITYALTLSGEKMPWLTTHIALPLCLLTGWYLGKVVEGLDLQKFFKQTWALLILIPVFLIGLANVAAPLLITPVANSLARDEQIRLLTWLGAVMLTGLVGYVIQCMWGSVGRGQMLRTLVIGAFVLLGVLTFRTAWLAAYINYDSAKEFLVYAHGAPSNKVIINYLEEISRRTTDGMNIRVAYDNLVSWPGSWYFRNFPNARYIGEGSGITDLDQNVAVVVGDGNLSKVEAQLAQNFYKYDLIRLWWPMQEYFNLNLKRVDDAFADAEMRHALWEIWWSRDYSVYTSAYSRMTGDTRTKFDEETWPVSDRLAFFVRKDIAAQLWDFAIGEVDLSTTAATSDPFVAVSCPNCTGDLAIRMGGGQTPLSFPRGVAVAPDGRVYVADSQNARIVIFGRDGEQLGQFGVPSVVADVNTVQPPPPMGTFREPWAVAVGKDGAVYVADTWNHRVQIFTAQGEPIRAWGNFEGPNPDQPKTDFGFYGPRAIAVDDQNRIYVADTGNMRVRVYNTEGAKLYDFGIQGTGPGQMYEPVGLAINNASQEIYVANTWNRRVDVFTLTGTFLRSWLIPGWYSTTPNKDSGNRPYIALSADGEYVFVTDPDAGRVLVFDKNGLPALTFGKLGIGEAALNEYGVLGGLAISNDGLLYLTDAGRGRVVRVRIDTLPNLRRDLQPIVPDAPAGGSPTQPKDF